MKRTTVKIPDDLDAKLRHLAAQRGVTISEVTRDALEAYLNGGSPKRRLLAAGAGASGETDISLRVEEILRDEWSDPRRS